MMTSTDPSASSSSSPNAPVWTNTTAPNRAAPVEDHTGKIGSSSTMDDELLSPVSTLDEPVSETIMRDVRAVGAKLKAVLIPLDRNVSGVAAVYVLIHRLDAPLTKTKNLLIYNCNESHYQIKSPLGYVNVLQEEDVVASDGQRTVINQLRDWDLWCVIYFLIVWICYYFIICNSISNSSTNINSSQLRYGIQTTNTYTIHTQQ